MSEESETEIRNKCIKKFDSIFNDNDLSTRLEHGIYQYVINEICSKRNLPINWDASYFKRNYMNKCISLFSNLTYIKNDNLLKKILNKEIDAYDLAFLSPQELFPENWKDLIDKKLAKDDFLYTNKHITFTDEYKCSKCKQKKCSTYELQTRSSDEPATVFVTCLNCGKKWHF